MNGYTTEIKKPFNLIRMILQCLESQGLNNYEDKKYLLSYFIQLV